MVVKPAVASDTTRRQFRALGFGGETRREGHAAWYEKVENMVASAVAPIREWDSLDGTYAGVHNCGVP